MKLLKLSAIICLMAQASVVQAQILWEENFDTLSTDQWNFDIGNGCPELCYWGNFEHQYYTQNNVYTDSIPGEAGNYGLVIEAKRENLGGMQFTSGRINSKGKINVKYGLIEVRMRVPDLETGLWPAFWLIGANEDEVGWPKSGEIDMMEMGQKESFRNEQGHPNSTVNDYVGANLIWYASAACNDGNPTCAAAIAGDAGFNKPYESEEPMNDRFVKYRLYWSQNLIRFAVVDDGVEYSLYESAVGITTGELAETFRNPFNFVINMAVGGNFTDSPSPASVTATMPAKMYIDYIRVSKFSGAGQVTIDGMVVSNEEEESTPAEFELHQNYPNPFNPSTNVSFTLPVSGKVNLSVFDIHGRKVTELANRNYVQGTHSITFDAAGLSSGIYFYALETNGLRQVQKMTLIK